jgi:hypothetical protein
MLLILDIDNTLIDTLHKSDYLEYQKKGLIRRPPDHVVEEMVVWERTNLKDFMNFLDEKIEYLGIWTNGNNFWLNFVITNILSKYISPSRFIIKYSIDKSTSHLLQERDKNGNNYQIKVFIKKLEDIFLSEMQFNKDNTLLLDDNLYNCFYNKYNSLPIKKFLIVNGEDSGLIKVMSILKNLRRCKSINNSLIKVYNGVNYEKLFT